jgi:RimJ/RimL family protein N-acetyltransferase
MYLHVVTYNEAAMRFYGKNGFSNAQHIKEHYTILERDYDAFLLYTVLDK